MTSSAEGWTLTVVPDIGAVSQRATDIVEDTVRYKPDAVITLPTGATPLRLFDILAARGARQEIDFSRVVFFSLDDYLGLRGTEPNSLTAWLKQTLFARINLDPARTFLVPAGEEPADEAAARYDQAISSHGGFDLAVVGIGGNGHVAFNEPGSPVNSRVRVVDLTPETIAQASAYWQDALPIPNRAMTVGIANLLESKHIVLLASGEGKARALASALEAPVSTDNPASMLRNAAGRFEVIADLAAASCLEKASAVSL